MFNLAAIQAPWSRGFTYPYEVSYGYKSDSDSSTYMVRTNSGTLVSNRLYTFSFWIRRTQLGAGHIAQGKTDSDNKSHFYFDSSNRLCIDHKRSAAWHGEMWTQAQFIDCSGWYHIHILYDCDNATTANKMIVHVNGLDVTTELGGWANANYPNAGEASRFLETGQVFTAGGNIDNTTLPFDGYLAEMYGIVGVLVPYTDFGQTKNGIWCPKAYTVGTNGEGTMSFKLDFSDNTNLGKDVSVNAANFTDANLGTDHQVTETPTNSYPTWDASNVTSNLNGLAEGGLQPVQTASNWVGLGCTKMLFSGKWYFEHTIGADNAYISVGVACRPQTLGSVLTTNLNYGWSYYSYALQLMANGGSYYKIISNAATLLADLGSYTSGDVLQVAFDVDTGKVWLGLNNTWTGSGDPAAGTNETVDFSADVDSGNLMQGMLPVCSFHSATACGVTNFGRDSFAYTPPTGFTGMGPENFTLPEGLLLAPNGGFEAIEYDGNGSTQSITGVGFQPDLVWIKNQEQLDSHQLFDSVRGAGYPLIVDTPAAEAENADTLTSFDSDGFSLGADVAVNTSGEKYSAWCLKKGAAYGFDMQTWTGDATAGKQISHDLGAIPEMIWLLNRTDGVNIIVCHRMMGDTLAGTWNNAYVLLDTNAAASGTLAPLNDTTPTSTIVEVGADNWSNGSGDDMIMYLFRGVPGFSKCFHYVANANANGVMVHCGFKPRFILIKNKSRAISWCLVDTAFMPSNLNVGSKYLAPDTNIVLTAYNNLRVTSQGFKLWSTGTLANSSNGEKFLGIAFADMPNFPANAF